MAGGRGEGGEGESHAVLTALRHPCNVGDGGVVPAETERVGQRDFDRRLPRLIGMSNALDMILTGRGVGAEEALRMGLANRVAPKGKSREVAEELAAGIASFPQTTMRNDRQSAYEQWSLDFDDAMRNELKYGNDSLTSGAAVAGAKRFAGGEGKHGQFK